MLKKLLPFFLLALLSFETFAQDASSAHREHHFMYAGLEKQPTFFPYTPIRPLNTATARSEGLSSAVFGYLPYWMYADTRNYLKYELLTHIACFNFDVDSTGKVTLPSRWPWTDVINTGHSNGVKMIACFTQKNFDRNVAHNVLTNTTARQNAITNIVNIVKQYQLDGANIDFEGLLNADRSAPIVNFMKELDARMQAENPAWELSFASPAVNYSNLWDLPGLANVCDYLMIMAYEYNGCWNKATGAGAPLSGAGKTVTTTVDQDYKAVSPSKLILGLPYYGYKWKAKTDQPLAATDSCGSFIFRNAQREAAIYGRLWDATTNTPWFKYQANNAWYQVWYDDAESLGLKYDLAVSRKYRGVGIWALGYDNGREELWNELKKRFYTVTALDDETSNTLFTLSQNAPNPFDTTTKIRYALKKGGYVSLKIYDIFHREIAVLAEGSTTAGEYEAEFNAAGLASGVYFCQLQVETLHATSVLVVSR